jgi:DNA-binding XRE family transcriptional regulator
LNHFIENLISVKALGINATAQGGWGSGLLLNPIACRQARATLGWSRRSLGSAANLSCETIRLFENGRLLHPNHLSALRQSLEAAGLEFIEDGGGRICVHIATK